MSLNTMQHASLLGTYNAWAGTFRVWTDQIHNFTGHDTPPS